MRIISLPKNTLQVGSPLLGCYSYIVCPLDFSVVSNILRCFALVIEISFASSRGNSESSLNAICLCIILGEIFLLIKLLAGYIAVTFHYMKIMHIRPPSNISRQSHIISNKGVADR